MSQLTEINIVNVGYRSTNCWVISAGTSRLLVDLGWPGSMGLMRARRRRLRERGTRRVYRGHGPVRGIETYG